MRRVKQFWETVRPVVLFAAAYVAAPLCITAAVTLVGFSLVATLDVWGDVDFVDGVPAAAAFVVAMSTFYLWLLRPAGRMAPRASLAAPFNYAKAVFSSNAVRQTVAGLVGTFRSLRRPFVGADGTMTNKTESAPIRNARRVVPYARLPLIHSVVWGKPINRAFVINCPINLRVEGNYEARK